MIGRLQGTLLAKQAPHLLLDVGGVGYEIEAPMSTFYQLPALGERLVLHTHLVVREDAHLLYGFATERERRQFRSLIKIGGVGAKLALTILSGITVDELVRCVRDNDSASLTRLPGVGKKTAERLIVEMRDRIREWESEGVVAEVPPPIEGASDAVRDAVSALIALGYKPNEASRLVRAIDSKGLGSEQIIRAALQSAVKSG